MASAITIAHTVINTNQPTKHIMKNTESIIQKQRPDVTALCNEYTDWLVTNLPRDYVVHEDCSAEAILWDSNKLKLNKDQIQWLRNFCMRWDKAYL